MHPRPFVGTSRSRRRAIAILALLMAAVVARTSHAAQRVTLRTDDGLLLSGVFYEPAIRPAPTVILVHMLQRSRRDWDSVAQRLAAAGIGALAFDLRGHGDSQGSAGQDFASMVLDIKAARRFVAGRPDAIPGRVGILGASLGANLAAVEAADDPAIASLALLSPSLDYRGIRIEAAVRKFGNRPVMLVASAEDGYASRSVRDLQKAGPGTRETLLLHEAGHGTNMLQRNPDLTGMLVDWFRKTLL